MRVILSLSTYTNLTGSEIYNYELARELARRGAFVSIIANNIGGEIAERTPKDIPLYHFFDHPFSEVDLVISSQPAPTAYMLTKFPDAVHFQVLHSVFSYEQPVIEDKISRYIAVRPEVGAHWIKEHPEINDRLKVIWNGVDTTRFNEKNREMRPNRVFTRLFIGTYDHLRANVVQELIQDAVERKTNLWLMLPENPFQGIQLPENVIVYPPTWKTELYTRQCDETASIFVGRTTIEGFMMGKPGLVYSVDDKGTIVDRVTIGVPENRHIFDITYMVDRLLENYEQKRA